MIKNNLLILIVSVLFVIGIILVFLGTRKDSENYRDSFKNTVKSHVFYNEKNQLIDHLVEEITEQEQCHKYIEPVDIVLELGGRYGSVSVVINKIVNNKSDHVVVEPDMNIIPALTNNKKLNDCNFTILPKFISNKNKKIVYDEYGTRIEDSDDKIDVDKQITYEQFKVLYPQKFNVLVADCEGCLGEFLIMMGSDFDHLKKVIFEADQKQLCDYNLVKDKLTKSGFREVENKDDFRFVYIRD